MATRGRDQRGRPNGRTIDGDRLWPLISPSHRWRARQLVKNIPPSDMAQIKAKVAAMGALQGLRQDWGCRRAWARDYLSSVSAAWALGLWRCTVSAAADSCTPDPSISLPIQAALSLELHLEGWGSSHQPGRAAGQGGRQGGRCPWVSQTEGSVPRPSWSPSLPSSCRDSVSQAKGSCGNERHPRPQSTLTPSVHRAPTTLRPRACLPID